MTYVHFRRLLRYPGANGGGPSCREGRRLMLIVTRKTDETITIEPPAGLDPATKFSEALERSAIEIRLVHIGGNRDRVAIESAPQLNIWRGTHASPEEATSARVPDSEDRGHRGELMCSPKVLTLGP